MNIIEALAAFANAAEHEAEGRARDLVGALEAHVEGIVSGLETRIAALETKLATDAVAGLSSLGDRVTALEKGAGLSVDDGAVATAIAGLTAPPPNPPAAQTTEAAVTGTTGDPAPAAAPPEPAAATVAEPSAQQQPADQPAAA